MTTATATMTGKIRLSESNGLKSINYRVYSGIKNEPLSDILDRMLMDTVHIKIKCAETGCIMFNAKGTLLCLPKDSMWQYNIKTRKAVRCFDSLLWELSESDRKVYIMIKNSQIESEIAGNITEEIDIIALMEECI